MRVAPAGDSAHDLAGLGSRFGGTLLDLLLLAAVHLLVLWGFKLAVPGALRDPVIVGSVSAGAALVFLLYFGVLNGRGQTLGKRMVGTRVVHYRTGEPIGVARGFVRAVVMALEQLPAMLGYLSILGPERRTFHDRAAHSVVVGVATPPRPPQV